MGETTGERILCWTLAIAIIAFLIYASMHWESGGSGGGGAHCTNVDVGAHGQAVCSD